MHALDAGRLRESGISRMRHPRDAVRFTHMPLWVLTIVICAAAWVIGTIVVALGASRLVHHEPH
jgi:hypothetical protein